jgi:hypothetical protein
VLRRNALFTATNPRCLAPAFQFDKGLEHVRSRPIVPCA